MLTCSCGGKLRPSTIPLFDFSALAGISATVTDVVGLSCDWCAGQTFDGLTIDSILAALAERIIGAPYYLNGALIRYSRKYLGMTQKELACRLGVSRGCVADWERDADKISHAHEALLRIAVILELKKRRPESMGPDTLSNMISLAIGCKPFHFTGSPRFEIGGADLDKLQQSS